MQTYLLFHSLTEITSATISFGTFLFAWNTRRFQNSYLLTVGAGALFVGLFETLHCLAFPGMAVFTAYDSNLSPQLWLSARFLQVAASLLGLTLLKRAVSTRWLLAGFGAAFVALCASVFWGKLPQVAALPAGLTLFKISSELTLAAAFLLSVVLLVRVREAFSRYVFRLLATHGVLMALCEICFALYTHPTDFLNLFGHLLLLAGGGVQYMAILRAGLVDPNDTHFRNLTREITERKHAEAAQQDLVAERGRLLESERSARSEAERANRSKDEFLANLSHELRTPLNAILGWSQLVRKGTDGATFDKGMEVIERNARIQAHLISDLLDMNRIISGKMRLEARDCDPVASLEAAIDSLSPAIEAKRIKIEKQVDPSHGWVLGDSSRLQQTFWNLLSNGVKFTPAGGTVYIEVLKNNSQIDIVVRDTGNGIGPDFLPYIFDRFRQADSSSSKSYGGLGLGLAIVKHLVELHGGAVKAESAGEGKGATFTVTLPTLISKPLDETRGGDGEGPASWSTALAGVKVLFVDDEPDTREMVTRLLEECGVKVAVAESAERAILILQEFRPDVLLSDIGMPDEDGYAMIRRIRRLPPDIGGQTPAIALTAYSRAEDRANAIGAGYQYHLAKPVESAELIAVIGAVTKSGS